MFPSDESQLISATRDLCEALDRIEEFVREKTGDLDGSNPILSEARHFLNASRASLDKMHTK